MKNLCAEAHRITRRFGSHMAVDRVSLQVATGEVVGLLGANGAGKTTLLRMLLGLIPPSDGEALLFGGPPGRAARRRVGYVPQGLGLYADLTPRENLLFTSRVFQRPPGGLPPEMAAETLPVGQLPLGMQRRVAFAQALSHHPDLLILDEPTSGVDPLMRARLWEAVRSAAESGAGVLVTTHHLQEAETCDRLVIMAAGRIVAQGRLAEILAGATVTVVESTDWSRALAALEAKGIAAGLSGRSLRVGEASPAEVMQALSGLDCRIREQPATLEERFVQIVSLNRDPLAALS